MATFPCYRVVNSSGRIALHFKEQKELLENEGICFKDAFHVDVKRFKWNV